MQFSDAQPDKSLGQHWLYDTDILTKIASSADVSTGDFVIEIGPGLGTLTDVLLEKGANVLAIEFDTQLYKNLVKKYKNNANIQVINQDILRFNFEDIAQPYKVVANIPYYLTSKLMRILADLNNRPSMAALLIQKEVARRIADSPGNMSKLSVFTQNSYNVSLGVLVGPEYFSPPPKVDSQVIILRNRIQKVVPTDIEIKFRVVVKAGFSEKRKKLRSSLSGGLRISKDSADELLKRSGIDPSVRAQELSIQNWISLAKNI